MSNIIPLPVGLYIFLNYIRTVAHLISGVITITQRTQRRWFIILVFVRRLFILR